MKKSYFISMAIGIAGLLMLAPSSRSSAQGVSQPLTIQGVENSAAVGARSVAMGGAVTSVGDSFESIFWNPAGLAVLDRPTFAAGMAGEFQEWSESQRWNPNRYYAQMSLRFQNSDRYAADAYGSPDWTESDSRVVLDHAGAAYPFKLGGKPVSLGLGYQRQIDLNSFDRNDNVLDPYIGSFRPEPIPRPAPGDSTIVEWSSYERQRTGSVNGVSAVVAAEPFRNVRLGARFSYGQGSSDDRESHVRQGVFTLREDANDFTFESASGSHSWTGTSDYTLITGAAGVQVAAEYFDVGFLVQFPTSINRDWSRTVVDMSSDGSSTTAEESGEEDITLPVGLTVGAALRPINSLTLAFDYHRQDLGDTSFDVVNGVDPLPSWYEMSGIRMGLEWAPTDQLFLRAGYRESPRPFRIEGSAILDEIGKGSVYSAGVGVVAQALQVDLVYAYHLLKYFDRWESNVNYAREQLHSVGLTARWSL